MIRLLMALFLLAVGSPAAAKPPDPSLHDVPDVLTLTPDGSFGYHIHLESQLGPVPGALVVLDLDAATSVKVGLCQGQAGHGGGILASGTSDQNGDVTFFVEGGGCVQVAGGPFVVQVRADGIVIGEPTINSPDIVDSGGDRPDESGANTCGAGGGADPDLLTVGLSDAVEHTGNIALGLEDACSNFTGPNFNDPVGLGDAVIVTEYVVTGTACPCQ